MQEYNKSFSEFQLFRHHLEKLTQEHGLNVKTIQEAGLFSATAQTLNQILHRTDIASDGIVSPYSIYGFNRARVDIPLVLNGNEVKYLSPTGSKNHLYIPSPVQSVLKDASRRLANLRASKRLRMVFRVLAWVAFGGLDPRVPYLRILSK